MVPPILGVLANLELEKRPTAVWRNSCKPGLFSSLSDNAHGLGESKIIFRARCLDSWVVVRVFSSAYSPTLSTHAVINSRNSREK